MAVLSGIGERVAVVRAYGGTALSGMCQARPEGKEHRRLAVRTARDLLDEPSGRRPGAPGRSSRRRAAWHRAGPLTWRCRSTSRAARYSHGSPLERR